MAQAFRGHAGSGSVLVYTVPLAYEMRLETLFFVLTCDGTAGVHKARVVLDDATISQTVAVIRDLNEGGPGETLTYTFGIGLVGSACVAVDGWDITTALPDTALAPSTEITLQAVDDGGVLIPGDQFAAVVLYGELDPLAATVAPPAVTLLPGLVPG